MSKSRLAHKFKSPYFRELLVLRDFMRLFVLFVLLCSALWLGAQGQTKSLTTTKINAEVKLDGSLRDSVWQLPRHDVAEDFVMFSPGNGEPIPEKYATKVKVYYSDEAIYIGANMHDPAPDSILTQYTQRDTYDENTAWFGVFINPFNDGLNDFNFWVTAAGTQSDSRTTAEGDDFGWNTIWSSAVAIHDSGWSCEFRIPYLSLRYPDNPNQDWGLNFIRNVRRHREQWSWNFIARNSGNRAEFQTGILKGMSDIQSPVRLSVIPYLSTYANSFKGEQSFDFNAGMDLKYGINESFTLDMTLIPDFGQVAVDRQFVNLSPFENRFQENRQFFTEGTELFSIGDIFYSRRIGGTPRNITGQNLGDTGTVQVRTEFTRLLNATKVSGRTGGNLGIGVLNAVTDESYTTLSNAEGEQERVLLEPLTNYNVVVFDQRFNRNSSVSFINTNVLREGEYTDANVAALVSSINLMDATYRIDASLKRSDRFKPDETQTGYETRLRFGDVSGNWQWAVLEEIRTDDYEINDLGFLQRSNQWRHYGEVSYQTFKPSGAINRMSHQLFGVYESLYEPRSYEEFYLGWNSFWLMRNFLGTGFDIFARPGETFDYFEPRRDGYRFAKPPFFTVSGFVSTDYRKTLALDANLSYTHVTDFNSNSVTLSMNPRLRLGDHFFGVGTVEISTQQDDIGYARDTDEEVFFGQRDVVSVTNAVEARYVFNPTTTLSINLRHLWTGFEYDETFLLQPQGQLEKGDFQNAEDLNFNTLNLDLRLSWWFAPASEMVLLYRNIIAANADAFQLNYARNLEQTFNAPSQNNLSLRISYFLDYNRVKQRLTK